MGAVGTGTLLLGSYGQAEKPMQKSFSVHKNRKTTLELVTAWPAHYPILGTAIDRFAKRCFQLSSGTLHIRLHPRETLLAPHQMFDAASCGEIDLFHSNVDRWREKNPALLLIGSLPPGETSKELTRWLRYGGGYGLWREIYARDNLYPLIGSAVDRQMGSWFKHQICTLSDLEGVKIHTSGLDAEVMEHLGIQPLSLKSENLLSSLFKGTLDAVKWSHPYFDQIAGLHRAFPYYYKELHPAISLYELTFNKERWEGLNSAHQAIIHSASKEMNSDILREFRFKNRQALLEFSQSAEIKTFPEEIIAKSKISLQKILEKQSASNRDFEAVLMSYNAFTHSRGSVLQNYNKRRNFILRNINET